MAEDGVPGELDDRRVVIVHERFTELGGSERCVEQFHSLWPDAPIHAAVLDRSALPAGLRGADIHPTGLQRLYRGGRRYSYLLPLLPAAMAHIDVGDAELVVVSHHSFAHRVRVPPGVPVVSYAHTASWWIWDDDLVADEVGGAVARRVLRTFAHSQRRPDRAAANRLTGIVACSRHVAGRIEQCWGRQALVVHPPIEIGFHTQDRGVEREDFFLLAGRLVPYKRPELAVAAAVAAGVRLVVAGDGRARSAVEAVAGPGIELLGEVDQATIRDLYRRCRALVFPAEEHFGIVPVEAQACGAPVIALRAGGVLESVIDGETGVLYTGEGPGPLAEALRSFDPDAFDSDRIRAHAERFGPERFRARFRDAVAMLVKGAEHC
jgi:glycosyltransferase involved in cell wall biosynthesis